MDRCLVKETSYSGTACLRSRISKRRAIYKRDIQYGEPIAENVVTGF